MYSDFVWFGSLSFLGGEVSVMVVLQKYCPRRKQATLREVGELRFYLMPAVLDELTLKILSPSSEITGFL
jgi:hypothetical protein